MKMQVEQSREDGQQNAPNRIEQNETAIAGTIGFQMHRQNIATRLQDNVKDDNKKSDDTKNPNLPATPPEVDPAIPEKKPTAPIEEPGTPDKRPDIKA